MKAITLHQPWATLVAIGAKQIETRSWRTAYRGPLAIHAGKSKANLSFALTDMCSKALARAGYKLMSDLPLGAVVCTVSVVDYFPTEQLSFRQLRRMELSEEEYEFGNYAAGRFGWILEDLHRFDQPIPAKGAQGLWEWKAK